MTEALATRVETRAPTRPAPRADGAEEEPVERDVAAISGKAPGPFLIEGPRDAGRQRVARLAARLGLEFVEVRADAVGLSGDAVADATAALRDAMFLRVRTMKKVFEGRLAAVVPVGTDAGPGASRLPPAAFDIHLETDSDNRRMRLEGPFARAFQASGAAVGDIVQIDKESPIVALRRDREAAEGFVAEERDFVYKVRLGDRDRAPAGTEAGGAVRAPLLGTGRLPPADLGRMAETDAWVVSALGAKGTRLEAGLLLFADADLLPAEVLVVLREAVATAASPFVVLQSEDPAALARWRAFFEAPLTL